ncbi:MAG: hypothetical protein U1F98_10250 [Verrucomicrobiota bacterium]
MNIRPLFIALACGAAALCGCKSDHPAAPAAPAVQLKPIPDAEMIAIVHWLGKRQIEADTNSAGLMSIWNQPESVALQNQTLDKLSHAPWLLTLKNSGNRDASAELRSLLAEMVQSEVYLEIRQATNEPAQIAFAIRIDDAHAGAWQSNLASVVEAVSGLATVRGTETPGELALTKHHEPKHLELVRVNDWNIFGAAADTNDLLLRMAARIHAAGSPLAPDFSKCWLTVAADLGRLRDVTRYASNLPATLPRISFDAVGDGKKVWTYGALTFQHPLNAQLEPWNIPASLIDPHLISFTALRGFGAWLEASAAWKNFHAGAAPNQACFWSLQGLPMQTYFTVPSADASNAVSTLSDWVINNNALLANGSDLVEFQRSSTYNGLEWKGLPYLSPFLQSLDTTNGNYIFGGLLPHFPGEELPLATLKELLSQTNLVYHGWESTSVRCEQWIYIAQFMRFVSKHAQIPDKSVSMEWLKAVAPKLGTSVTQVALSAPDQLSFNRKSNIGLTAIELQFLADWLESPRFPVGLNSLLSKPQDEQTQPASMKN